MTFFLRRLDMLLGFYVYGLMVVGFVYPLYVVVFSWEALCVDYAWLHLTIQVLAYPIVIPLLVIMRLKRVLKIGLHPARA
jgi:hypothetical protein